MSLRSLLLNRSLLACVHRRQVDSAAGRRPISSSSGKPYDVLVIGGGIIGCAVARELLIRSPQMKIALVEKENHLAAHQSGHNSGVVHAGIYYAPGSLRAKLCVQGSSMAYEYCDQKGIAYKKCGKLIVAVDQAEVKRLEELFRRAQTNGCRDVEWIDGPAIARIEPNCRGLAAIWSPHTGIVDWAEVTRSYADDFRQRGGSVHLGFTANHFRAANEKQVEVANSCSGQTVRARFVVAAAGLQADRVAQLTGGTPSPRIVPFRGEYLLVKPERSDIVRTNIYPVPDPQFPFLGVHFTPRIDGSLWLGPNAVLAFHREGYRQLDISAADTMEALSHRGLRKLAAKHLVQGLSELYRSLNVAAQVKLLRRFVPSLSTQDVVRGPSGVRAQALDDNGNLVDDFVFDSGRGELKDRVLHVRNAPSPAATSSLAIARMIADRVNRAFPFGDLSGAGQRRPANS